MVPPFVGAAVKVTASPVQIVVVLAVIDTLGVTDGFTVMVSVAVLVGAVVQAAFEVIVTETTSPLASVEEVNVTPVAPVTSTPFTAH